MTRDEQQRLLQTLAGVYAYYERELTEFAVSVWVEDLQAFAIDAIERAFTAHRRDPQRGQWLPKSADILRHLTPVDGEAGALAWTQLMAEVRSCGSYGRPRIDASTRLALDTVGGWGALCRAQERELPHLQRRFLEAFGIFEARAARCENDLPLLGGDVNWLRIQ